MKRYLIVAVVICLTLPSLGWAQGGLFRDLGEQFRQQGGQIIQRELGLTPGSQQGGQDPNQPRSMGALPNESGPGSGGGQQGFRPGPGGGFMLPGGPGQPQYNQPLNRAIYDPTYRQNYQPGYQNQSFVQNQGRPAGPVDSSRAILIRCADGTQGSLSYSLSAGGRNYGYAMAGGQEQHLGMGDGWIISFYDGVQQRRYRLLAGQSYVIKRDEQLVWKLFASKK